MKNAMCFILMVLFLGACTTNRLFYADFDAETTGQRPSASPPGDPVGDTIYMSKPAGGGPDPAVVIVESGSDKALRYSNIDIPLWHRFFSCVAVEIAPDTEKYTLMWNGKLANMSNASALEVFVGSPHFGKIAGIRFKDGKVFLQTAAAPSIAYEELGAFSQNLAHTVIFRVFKNTQQYSFSLLQSGGSNLNSGTRTVLNTTYLNTLKPTAHFYFSEDSHSNGTYTIDNVLISEDVEEE